MGTFKTFPEEHKEELVPYINTLAFYYNCLQNKILENYHFI